MKTCRNTFMNNFFLRLLMVIAFGVSSCQEDLGLSHVRTGEQSAPPTNLTFEEAPGGATISYNLPTHPDLRYVKATYTLENGRTMVGKASLYDNSIKVEGFAQIGDYDVTLVAVSVGEVASAPVSIRIRTGKPSYQIIAESFQSSEHFYSTFGGVNVFYENAAAANLILRTFRFGLNPETNGREWLLLQETYTRALNGTIRVRGQQPQEERYGVVVRDQWGNVSDTIERLLTPQEEYKFEGIRMFTGIQPYSEQNRNGDFVRNNAGQANSADMQIAFFDGVEATPFYNTMRQWWGSGTPIPFQFTMDLGRASQISRIKMWGRNDNQSLYFQATHPKEFELYGSNAPAADGSWDSWTRIGTYEGVRPSGLPFGTNANAEDITYARTGEDFEVDWEHPGGFRYFRIRVNSTWNGIREQVLNNALTVAIAELQLFGVYVN
ncbi:DUF5000 domain-containing lipoprotein [Sphingobacterium bambusae]|uniref:DUF5000 domain-containing lipoprotein n=1 Tax=Sphingobacterium bambusae TaxID=662858 RepID=A0ABW6BA20_9SPHI|nr:DUF5000 domain-containing lipoprotein [Sphingobacterium bambusae]WPL48375.1 DUF5000 domain-containing lipoprotein [Sphingobacterium bambusae]